MATIEPGVVVTLEGTGPDGSPTLLRGRVVAADDTETAVRVETGLRRSGTSRGEDVALRWFQVDGIEGACVRVTDVSTFTETVVVTAPESGAVDERRSAPRLRRAGEVHLPDGTTGRLRDLGRNGLRFVASGDGPDEGERVTLAVDVGDGPFELTGVVIGDGPEGTRLRFDALPADTAERLGEVLDAGVRG